LQSKASILPGIVGQTNSVKPHSQRDQYVAWVAVLRQVKRADLLVEIARKMPNTRFVVCGGSSRKAPVEYTEWIIRELRSLPNIEYLGHVPPERTLQIIADAAMLVSTSDGEGFPSVFLEAWAFGTPVISLKIDPDGVIQEKKLGRVSGSVDKAIEDIQGLMDTPGVREEMAIPARQHVAENHNESATINAFEHGIRNLSKSSA
jgi:glycosyltransferase involved in cell wall biosynthesis